MGIQANQLLGRDLEPGECVGPLFVCDGEDLAIHGTKTTVNAALESEGIDVKPTVDRILNSVHRKLSDSWIPVEERLPEERGCWYQVTRIIGTERWVTDSYWSGDFWQHEDVIAWKPLPEAYQPPN